MGFTFMTLRCKLRSYHWQEKASERKKGREIPVNENGAISVGPENSRYLSRLMGNDEIERVVHFRKK